jgi:hypothetical protein
VSVAEASNERAAVEMKEQENVEESLAKEEAPAKILEEKSTSIEESVVPE